jgi:hypothetical protein
MGENHFNKSVMLPIQLVNSFNLSRISTFQFPRFPFVKDWIYASLRQVSSRERLPEILPKGKSFRKLWKKLPTDEMNMKKPRGRHNRSNFTKKNQNPPYICKTNKLGWYLK